VTFSCQVSLVLQDIREDKAYTQRRKLSDRFTASSGRQ
jgi:hypothetical protein